MSKRTLNALLSREIRKSLAEEISKTYTLRDLQQMERELLLEIGLNNEEITSINEGSRPPINDDVILSLLHNSKYVCAICQDSSFGVIIHHINEWHVSKNHSYENLIVLCPNHHDLAHTSKELTKKLSIKQLKFSKKSWEDRVENERKKISSGRLLNVGDGYRLSNKGKLVIFSQPADFLEHRITKGFPGITGYNIYDDPIDATERLLAVLNSPLVFDESIGHETRKNPIYWYRGYSSNSIREVKRLDSNHILINCVELNVKRVIVYRSRSSSRRNFIYCEFAPDPIIPEGSKEYIEEAKHKESENYSKQNYGIFKEWHTSFEELDDGGMSRGNEIINFDNTAEYRERYLTNYNFIISYKQSIFINPKLESLLLPIMDDINLEKDKFENWMDSFKRIVGDG